MFKTMLFPVDLFEVHSEALKQVVQIAELAGSVVHFLHVRVPVVELFNDDSGVLGSSVVTPFGAEFVRREMETLPQIETMIHALHAACPSLEKMQCRYAVQEGALVDVVRDYVHDNAVDLVIVEHDRHHGLLHWLFKPGDEAILESVDVPLLVLPR